MTRVSFAGYAALLRTTLKADRIAIAVLLLRMPHGRVQLVPGKCCRPHRALLILCLVPLADHLTQPQPDKFLFNGTRLARYFPTAYSSITS